MVERDTGTSSSSAFTEVEDGLARDEERESEGCGRSGMMKARGWDEESSSPGILPCGVSYNITARQSSPPYSVTVIEILCMQPFNSGIRAGPQQARDIQLYSSSTPSPACTP